MSAEREYSSAPAHTGAPEHEVPFLPWIEILVGECQDAEDLPGLVCSEGRIDLGRIVLLDAHDWVYPLSNFMIFVEVNWRLFDRGLAYFWLGDDLPTRADHLNAACPEVSFTI